MIETISTGINSVLELVRELINVRNDRRERTMKAIRQVLTAATETRSYLKTIKENPDLKSRDEDMRICHLWLDAGSTIYFIDQEIGDKCMIKADCWSDDRLWKSDKYKHIPVDLDGIIDGCNQILKQA